MEPKTVSSSEPLAGIVVVAFKHLEGSIGSWTKFGLFIGEAVLVKGEHKRDEEEPAQEAQVIDGGPEVVVEEVNPVEDGLPRAGEPPIRPPRARNANRPCPASPDSSTTANVANPPLSLATTTMPRPGNAHVASLPRAPKIQTEKIGGDGAGGGGVRGRIWRGHECGRSRRRGRSSRRRRRSRGGLIGARQLQKEGAFSGGWRWRSMDGGDDWWRRDGNPSGLASSRRWKGEGVGEENASLTRPCLRKLRVICPARLGPSRGSSLCVGEDGPRWAPF
ncbi:hypothetical protein TRIUR3_35405 [Triticum urartu]|uniref:Uncharacterized protein n=1 Tax=Triticum urartu TaxID=4572 RepID=M7ZPG2_TRIUA|nr:hypothetical protein TRIUR3_35405 [Triticum urartu]